MRMQIKVYDFFLAINGLKTIQYRMANHLGVRLVILSKGIN